MGKKNQEESGRSKIKQYFETTGDPEKIKKYFVKNEKTEASYKKMKKEFTVSPEMRRRPIGPCRH